MNINNKIVNDILKIKKNKNALILSHFYQKPEIQEISDFVGDSLELAKISANNNANIIVFCGVHFMAETAKILSPEKKILLPDLEAGCSLAESCPSDEFKKFKNKYPDHKVISYINCSAEIKTLSDIICTSSNAVKIVNSFSKNEKLIFAPDKNLGNYINRITGRKMVLWEGTCEVHDLLNIERVIDLKLKHSDAEVIAHPECKGQILEIADFVGSTSKMLNYTKESSSKKFIVATETGIIHQMKKHSPEKDFYIVSSDESCNCNDCEYMKVITLEKVLLSLKDEIHEICIDEKTINSAFIPINRMLNLS